MQLHPTFDSPTLSLRPSANSVARRASRIPGCRGLRLTAAAKAMTVALPRCSASRPNSNGHRRGTLVLSGRVLGVGSRLREFRLFLGLTLGELLDAVPRPVVNTLLRPE